MFESWWGHQTNSGLDIWKSEPSQVDADLRQEQKFVPESAQTELQTHQGTRIPPPDRRGQALFRGRLYRRRRVQDRHAGKRHPQRPAARYIHTKNTPLLTENEVQRILLKINGSMLERSQETSRQHVLHLNRKFGNSANATDRERQLVLLKTLWYSWNFAVCGLAPEFIQIAHE
jgi:hypothetical protein